MLVADRTDQVGCDFDAVSARISERAVASEVRRLVVGLDLSLRAVPALDPDRHCWRSRRLLCPLSGLRDQLLPAELSFSACGSPFMPFAEKIGRVD